MKEKDRVAILEQIQHRLRRNGLDELANADNYIRFEDGERRIPTTLETCVGMLKAFEARLALRDKATYDDAIEKIRKLTESTELKGAVILREPVSELDRTAAPLDFSGLQNLGPLRAEVLSLASMLIDEDREAGI